MPKLWPIAASLLLCAGGTAAWAQRASLPAPVPLPPQKIVASAGKAERLTENRRVADSRVRQPSRAAARPAAKPLGGPAIRAKAAGNPALARPTRANRAAKADRRAGGKVPAARVTAPELRASEASAPPLVLTPAQRSVIYHIVVREQGVPVRSARAAPIQRERIVAGPLATGQIITARPKITDEVVISVPEPAVPVVSEAGPPTAAEDHALYPVGSTLPPAMPIYAIPPSVTLQVPHLQRYGYTLVRDRVLLVDPMTNLVVTEVR